MNATSDELEKTHKWTEARFTQTAEPFFSYSYDGQSSEKVLKTWKLECSSTRTGGHVEQHDLTYTDPRTGLLVRCVGTEYSDFPAVEWVMYFKNTGRDASPIIENIQPLDIVLNCKDRVVLHYSRGSYCSPGDFEPIDRILPRKAQAQLRGGGGRSSSETLPFFNLELLEEGIVIAVGWTGEWSIKLSRNDGSELRVQAGMASTHLRLYEGEEIRSPRILLLFWSKDRMRGHNLLRQFILRHHRPLVNGKPLDMPIFTSSWGGVAASTHLAKIRQIVTHNLPIGYYWIDAEWFGVGDWWKNPGSWEVKKDLYPQGFRPISDALHRTGRKLLLWFEIERVSKGTAWYNEHADWLLSIKEGDEVYSWPHFTDMADPVWAAKESNRNQIQDGDRLFNLGNPEALHFLTDFVSDKISEFGLDCFRQDFNIAPLKFWQNADLEDRQGISEIKYVQGLYSLWKELLRRNPNLIIDNCASGGRRIDLESVGLSTPFWRTDYSSDVIATQCHSYGIQFWLPMHSEGVVDMTKDDDYTLRSLMSSGLIIDFEAKGDDSQQDAMFGNIRKRLDQYLAVQKFFYGDYYPLTQYSQARDAWMAYQLDRPDLGEGLLVILKRPSSPFMQGVFQLKSLQSDVRFEITNLDTHEKTVMSGEELTGTGLEVNLARKPDSALIVYKSESHATDARHSFGEPSYSTTRRGENMTWAFEPIDMVG